jgi:hypothetical protein
VLTKQIHIPEDFASSKIAEEAKITPNILGEATTQYLDVIQKLEVDKA